MANAVTIVISLLNAFTGLSVAASGYVLDNVLLLVAGTLVGASGTLLTQLMAKAMGRPLTSTLFGAFTAKASTATSSAVDRPVKSAGPSDIAIMLTYATKVIIVPGYGLAVAQAQQTLRELVDLLISKGVEVEYAIHPVAPTRVPATSNKTLSNTYPLAATDKPVNAFNKLITIGTSAPPTGSTNKIPITSDKTTNVHSAQISGEIIK